MGESLLDVSDLRVAFPAAGGMAEAARGVSFTIEKGEAVGLLGESGSGKSVSALAMMGLIAPPGRITGGSIHFAGRDLLALSETEMRRVRGHEISIVFQDPLTAFNPAFRVGRQLLHVIRAHESRSRAKARRRALEVLDMVGLPYRS